MGHSTGRLVTAALALAGIAAPIAAAVPITVPRIVVNDGHRLEATGTVSSPPSATSCTALVRVQLQVPDHSMNRWRAVRALGRHRIDVCETGSRGWTRGSVTVWMTGMERLRSQQARLCWSATQMVNGTASQHVSCKRFSLKGGS